MKLSPTKTSMLYAPTQQSSSNVSHCKKGVLSIIRGQFPTLDERHFITKEVRDTFTNNSLGYDAYIPKSIKHCLLWP